MTYIILMQQVSTDTALIYIMCSMIINLEVVRELINISILRCQRVDIRCSRSLQRQHTHHL